MKKFNEKRNETKIKNKPAVKKVEKSSIVSSSVVHNYFNLLKKI